MNKSGTLITSALLTFGIAAAAIAADSPNSTASIAANTPANGANPAPPVGPKEDQRAVDTSPPKSAGKPSTSTHKHKKSNKPVIPAPTTTQ
jgi:hypothetical protein